MSKFARRLFSIHKSAVQGFTAEGANLYNVGRPSYSFDSFRKIDDILNDTFAESELVKFVELGAGTGKFTKAFDEYYSYVSERALNKIDYLATEPSSGFRASLAKDLPEYMKVADGVGSKIPVESKSIDGVFVAQAFHWMATVDTLKEVHRVLKHERPFIMIWNTYDRSHDWIKQIDDQILNPAYDDNVPRQQTLKWKECFQTSIAKELFSPLKYWYKENPHQGPEQLIYDRILSTSVIAEKSEDEKAKVLEHLQSIVRTHPDLAMARRTEQFIIPYITEIAWVIAK